MKHLYHYFQLYHKLDPHELPCSPRTTPPNQTVVYTAKIGDTAMKPFQYFMHYNYI